MAYPVILDLRNRPAAVIGGGSVARRKAEVLIQDGARLTIIAPDVTDRLAGLIADHGLEWRQRGFEPSDLDGCFLAVAATDDDAVNRAVFRAAEERRIFCNVVDQPHLCSFIVPAVVRRGDLILAISTSGASPVTARTIKENLAEQFDEAWGEYIDLLARVRRLVLARGNPPEENRPVFEAVASAGLLEPLRSGDREELDRRLKAAAGLTLDEVEGSV